MPVQRVTQVLDCLMDLRGKPERLVSDNGPKFAGHIMDQGAYQNGVVLDFIDPVKPRQNEYVESFNGKSRDEYLNEHWFRDVAEAQEKHREMES